MTYARQLALALPLRSGGSTSEGGEGGAATRQPSPSHRASRGPPASQGAKALRISEFKKRNNP